MGYLDFAYPWAIFLSGFFLAKCDFHKARQGFLIHILIIIGILALLFVCVIYMYLVFFANYFAENVESYKAMYVAFYIFDAFTTFTMEMCYMLRLQVFIVHPALHKLSYLLLIVPIVYVTTADLMGILYVYIPETVTLDIFVAAFNGGNTLLSVNHLFTHSLLSHLILVHLRRNGNKKMPTVLIFLPLISTILFGVVSIWGMLDLQAGTGLISFFWFIEWRVFMFVNELIVKHIVKRHDVKSKADGSSIVSHPMEKPASQPSFNANNRDSLNSTNYTSA